LLGPNGDVDVRSDGSFVLEKYQQHRHKKIRYLNKRSSTPLQFKADFNPV
jgi:hypothetical protein